MVRKVKRDMPRDHAAARRLARIGEFPGIAVDFKGHKKIVVAVRDVGELPLGVKDDLCSAADSLEVRRQQWRFLDQGQRRWLQAVGVPVNSWGTDSMQTSKTFTEVLA